jgi:hypothetical protein
MILLSFLMFQCSETCFDQLKMHLHQLGRILLGYLECSPLTPEHCEIWEGVFDVRCFAILLVLKCSRCLKG